MNNNEALIVVDLQQDFCEGGSLAVPKGDEIVPLVNSFLSKFDLVIFTKDWHHPEMEAFESYQMENHNRFAFDKFTNAQGKEDTIWPDHCVANTLGADFHPSLDLGKCKKDFYIFKKGNSPHYHPYSGFGEISEYYESELEKFLKDRGIDTIHVCGLALDFCVKETALDGVKLGFKTYVIKDACRAINPDTSEVDKAFKEAGVIQV